MRFKLSNGRIIYDKKPIFVIKIIRTAIHNSVYNLLIKLPESVKKNRLSKRIKQGILSKFKNGCLAQLARVPA